MEKFKTQKGITLVALVITIIVLLILAVVAIGAVRDSGIIGHAQNSADRYNTGKLEEESMLGQYEDEISKYETEGSFGTSGEDENETIPTEKAKTLNGNMKTIFDNVETFYQNTKWKNGGVTLDIKLTLKDIEENTIIIKYIEQDSGYNGVVSVEVNTNNNSVKYVWDNGSDQYNYKLEELECWCRVTDEKVENYFGSKIFFCEKINELPIFSGKWTIDEENTTDLGKQYFSNVLIDVE